MSIASSMIKQYKKDSKRILRETRINELEDKINELNYKHKKYVDDNGVINESLYNEIRDLEEEKDIISEINENSKEENKKYSRTEIRSILEQTEAQQEKEYERFCRDIIEEKSIEKLEKMYNKMKETLGKAKEKTKQMGSNLEKSVSEIKDKYLSKKCTKCGDVIRKKKKNKEKDLTE